MSRFRFWTIALGVLFAGALLVWGYFLGFRLAGLGAVACLASFTALCFERYAGDYL